MAWGGDAFAACAQGTDLCAHRRPGGGAYHFAARANRRLAQLGLSLLLAARRDLCPAFAAELRLPRGSRSLAGMVVASGRRQPRANADHVRPARRTPPAGDRTAMACRLRKFPA